MDQLLEQSFRRFWKRSTKTRRQGDGRLHGFSPNLGIVQVRGQQLQREFMLRACQAAEDQLLFVGIAGQRQSAL
jgi:hypothetical protein